MPKLFSRLSHYLPKRCSILSTNQQMLLCFDIKGNEGFFCFLFFPIFFQGKCVFPSFAEGSCAECHWQKVQQDRCTGCFAFQHPARCGGHPKKLQSTTNQREFPGKFVLWWCIDESTYMGLAPIEGNFPISFCRHKAWPVSSFVTFHDFCPHHLMVLQYDDNRAE